VSPNAVHHIHSPTRQLNASDDRGIDVVREQIKTFAETGALHAKPGFFKLIVLDEADMMTQAAQSALRRVIEQYTRNVRFCIICNYVNKITPAIQSRCTRFRFSPLPMTEVEKRLQTVIEAEDVNVTEDGKAALLKLSRGDMRRALNVLQACNAAYDVTDETAVYACTGNPLPSDIELVVNSMMTDEFGTCYQSGAILFDFRSFSHTDSPCLFVELSALKTDRGLALQDLITGAYEHLDGIQLPPQSLIYLLDHLATTEYVP
jgi:replication factor C subunit 3/5